MTLSPRIPRSLGAAALAALVLAALVAASPASAGTSFLSPSIAKLTNARYNHDCFWAPPKGVDYGDLPGATPIQKPNLYPDVGSTYFVAQYYLPAGSSLTFHGTFGHQRYMSWTMFANVGGGQTGPGDHLRDVQLKPDPGSINPFLPSSPRNSKAPRKYTMHIVQGPVPAKRAANTIYTDSTDPSQLVGMSERNYLPDNGRDGTGDAGLPQLTLDLADGQHLTGQAACDVLRPSKAKSTSTYPAAGWKQLVASSSDPVNAPAKSTPVWERFWNAAYNVSGVFVTDPVQRVSLYPPIDNGGFQSNPDTRYLLAPVSLKFGPVITVSGKMPTFPSTLPHAARWQPKSTQVRYWSLCTGSSPVSGLGYDCVYDQQVPLRGDRRYTLVISRPQDRPKNATAKCGYGWLTFGDGENYGDPAQRDYEDNLYMRFMAANPSFKQAPQKVTKAGTEAKVMGAYFPRSTYSSKAAFEKLGCKKA